MGTGVLILGHSGSGKSASMRNCTADRNGIINVALKGRCNGENLTAKVSVLTDERPGIPNGLCLPTILTEFEKTKLIKRTIIIAIAEYKVLDVGAATVYHICKEPCHEQSTVVGIAIRIADCS